MSQEAFVKQACFFGKQRESAFAPRPQGTSTRTRTRVRTATQQKPKFGVARSKSECIF